MMNIRWHSDGKTVHAGYTLRDTVIRRDMPRYKVEEIGLDEFVRRVRDSIARELIERHGVYCVKAYCAVNGEAVSITRPASSPLRAELRTLLEREVAALLR